MTILTPSEAANWVRSTETDQIMLMLMPQVDAYLERATGRDWSADAVIHPMAKTAAGALLVNWYDNPSFAGNGMQGLSDVLIQLEVEALKYRKYEFAGASSAGAISLPGALEGDDVIKLVGVYGVSGDQNANFETEISVSWQIQQTGGDLSANIYVVILKSPAEDVTA
jgi:hypothetical protein